MGSLRAWFGAAGRGETAARLAVVAVFLLLIARWWHPHEGFTRFLVIDTEAGAALTPAAREAPLYVYPAGSRYDGAYYAQIATDPTLRDPHLGTGIDALEYRARRILAPLLAYGAAGGDPAGALRVYAGINLVAWLALAAVLWGLLPTGDWRRFAAWAGVLGAAGAWHSVRLSLVDLPALVWLTAALLAWERRHVWLAAGLFALAGLTRETTLLAAIAVAWTMAREGPRIRAAAWLATAVAPTGAWLLALRMRFGGGDGGGWDNFDLPLSGLAAKGTEIARSLSGGGDRWLMWTTAVATVALVVQAAFFLRRRTWTGAWGLIGAGFAALVIVLDVAVWEGHPGAATRVLLPLTLAFFVVAARTRASWLWIIAGAGTLPAGVLALVQVPTTERELSAGRGTEVTYTARAGAEFYPLEHADGRTWAWASAASSIAVETSPRATAERTLTLELRTIAPRRMEVRQDGRILWAGEVGSRRQTLRVEGVRFTAGRAQVEIASDAAPVTEGAGGRALGFAVFAVRVE